MPFASFAQDLRYALRVQAKNPGFTAIAVVALALGIGANTAIFSVVNGVLLRPLAFRDAGDLVVVLQKSLRSGADHMPVAPASYTDIKQQNRSFASIGAAEVTGGSLTGDGQPEQITGLRMTASVFDVLGMPPLVGRTFREDEEETGRHRVVVLTHQLWQRRFGADPSIVGKAVNLSGEPFQVIGVMPPEFRFPPFWNTRAEMYVPLAFSPERKASRGGNSLRLFARLRPGVPLDKARADVETIAAGLAADYPNSNTNVGMSVTPLHEMVVGKVRNALLILLASVGFVLLIACANVANLLLARSIARQKEIAVRAALGAGRLRIVRQLLTESVLLATIAGAAGIALAAWGIELIQMAFADTRLQNVQSLPRLQDVQIDSSVLFFALAVSIFTGILFGLAPALQTSRHDANETLKENSRGLHGSANALRRTLVAGEVACTVMLLIGAGLLLRSFWNILQIDPGFRSENLLTAHVNVSGTSVSPENRQVQFYRTVLERAASLPGVTSVAAINHLPLAGDRWGNNFILDDRPEPAPGDRFNAVYRVISPGYFQTMGTRVLKGREFDGSDVNAQAPVAVINETMAKRYWLGADPTGRRLRFAGDSRWITIAGVVQDVRQRDWTGEADPEIYVCYTQHPEHFRSMWSSAMTFVMRTSGDPHTLAKPLQDLVWSQDSRIPFTEVATMDEVVAGAVRQPRTYAALLGTFAIVAFGLAIMGIYGVISYAVAQRTQELGVRMAVGASPADLIRLLLAGGLRVVVSGAAVGFAASLVLSRAVASLLYGVQPNDLVTIGVVAGVVLLVATIAIYLPARRVSRIDPVVALRVE
jgi:putative ABC transport system permease protein